MLFWQVPKHSGRSGGGNAERTEVGSTPAMTGGHDHRSLRARRRTRGIMIGFRNMEIRDAFLGVAVCVLGYLVVLCQSA